MQFDLPGFLVFVIFFFLDRVNRLELNLNSVSGRG